MRAVGTERGMLKKVWVGVLSCRAGSLAAAILVCAGLLLPIAPAQATQTTPSAAELPYRGGWLGCWGFVGDARRTA